jgi:hypothetical protein
MPFDRQVLKICATAAATYSNCINNIPRDLASFTLRIPKRLLFCHARKGAIAFYPFTKKVGGIFQHTAGYRQYLQESVRQEIPLNPPLEKWDFFLSHGAPGAQRPDCSQITRLTECSASIRNWLLRTLRNQLSAID